MSYNVRLCSLNLFSFSDLRSSLSALKIICQKHPKPFSYPLLPFITQILDQLCHIQTLCAFTAQSAAENWHIVKF